MGREYTAARDMTNAELALHVFLLLLAILAACKVVGVIARRLGQAQVIAEMVTGFLLGPSLLGWAAPDVSTYLFRPQVMPVVYGIAQIALTLYMFTVGLEFESGLLRRSLKQAAAVSLTGILAPFALGIGAAILLHGSGGFFAPSLTVAQAALFMGASLSITAFPVMARIIHERGLTGTAIGTMALAAGAMDDVAAWLIFAVVVASFKGDASVAVVAFAGAFAYVAIVFGAVRPYLRRLAQEADAAGEMSQRSFGTVLMLLMAGAWFTDLVGVHSVFGAFILGTAMPRGLLARELQRVIGPLTLGLFIPLFFVYSGLHTSVGLVDTPSLWLTTVAIFGIACLGKGVACWLAARLNGATQAEALGIGTLMNARGMMELILLNIGRERGLITPTLFTILVLMTLATTLMATPLFGLLYRPAADAAIDDDAAAVRGA
jgi:Kef-type K+ transport system membrane component KefB